MLTLIDTLTLKRQRGGLEVFVLQSLKTSSK
jgi:hypothetical protein